MGLSKLSPNDKYYTTPETVRMHIQHTERAYKSISSFPLVVEPSAGSGSFVESLKAINRHVLAYDVEPDGGDIKQMDWLTEKPDVDLCHSLIIGNPPFGKNSSLAVKFFNRSAEHNPEVISFILPKTFSKRRWWSGLSVKYSLSSEMQCPKNSFILNGNIWDVPCVSQVWIRGDRHIKLPSELTLFSQVSPKVANCFIRRVGGRAGKVVKEYTPSTTYSVSCSENTISCLLAHERELSEYSRNTAGVRSITLLEVEDILLGRYL